MNELQQLAFKIFLDSADLSNDFKPITEEALATKLKAMGYQTSSSAINRWKAKFSWNASLEEKVSLAITNEPQIKSLVAKSTLDSVVENTKVDIARNDLLMAGCYEIAETELKRIIAVQKEKGTISKDDFKRFEFLMSTSTARNDKMLDRLALAPIKAVTAEEVLSRLSEVTIDVEEDTEDAEVIE